MSSKTEVWFWVKQNTGPYPMCLHVSSGHICLPFLWPSMFHFPSKVRALPLPPPLLPSFPHSLVWALAFLPSLLRIPEWKGLLKGTWFSLQMGPLGHLRSQLDLHANDSVPHPAQHSLREGWDEGASQPQIWAVPEGWPCSLTTEWVRGTLNVSPRPPRPLDL